jgi:hypothetical protein
MRGSFLESHDRTAGRTSMKNTDRLYFARAETGAVVQVQDVQRGLACQCTCLGCGGHLVAKQGSKVVWHFAHEQPADQRSCGETALHLAAKAVLLTLPAMWLPPAEWSLPSLHDSTGRELPVLAHGAGQMVTIGSVELELGQRSALGAVRLDALLTTSVVPVGVEVLVTHAVDETKKAALTALQLPALEIDLSAYVQDCTTFEQLKGLLHRGAPRTLVAGASVLFNGAEARATKAAEERLASIEAALTEMQQMTPQEREREVALARRAGVSLVAPPRSLGSLRWLTTRPEGEHVPSRVFGGTHHRLWQLAAMAWLSSQRNGARLSFSSMLDGVSAMLGTPPIGAGDGRSADALRTWLEGLDWPGCELVHLYNDDHGWGDDWYRFRRAAGALTDDRQQSLW